MAVGRHRAVNADGSDAGKNSVRGTGNEPAAANHELLGWGIFLAATAAAAMVWAGIGWPIVTGCCLLLLLSFVAVWRVQRGTAVAVVAAAAVPSPAVPSPAAPEPAAAEPAAAEPAAAEPAALPAPAAASPGAAASAETPAPVTRKQMRAADPSTGLLPVVPVFGRAVAQAPGSAQKGIPPVVPGGRRERRHATASPASPVPAAGRQSPDPVRHDDPADTMARTLAAITAGRTSAPVIIQAVAYGPAPEPAVPDGPAGPASGNAEASGDAGDSRWTRTFGPPETGQLPVQRYVAGTAADSADPTLPDRRQRSHSSL